MGHMKDSSYALDFVVLKKICGPLLFLQAPYLPCRDAGKVWSCYIDLVYRFSQDTMAGKTLVLALDTIKSVEESVTVVIVNQHQCRRLVDFYSRVGKLLTHILESANSSRDDGDQLLLPSLVVTLSVLQKGRNLIEGYCISTDWVGRLFTSDVNKDSFEAIHVELEGCIQSIYGARHIDLQVKVPKGSVMPLVHLSEGDRETLFDADANKDRKQMQAMIETRRNTLSQSLYLDPNEKAEVRSLAIVAEKISESLNSPGLIEQLPSYLRIKAEEIDFVPHPLGCGGSADVYKCRWLHHDYAVKIFRGYDAAGMSKEIMNLIRLRHPNIVQLIGFSVDREPMLVMELLDCDLRDIIKERVSIKPPFSLNESIGFMYQIAAGMAYLHKKNIFHGDLKSKNVLVAKHAGGFKHYGLKISDFGVSTHVNTDFANDEDFATSKSLTGYIGTTRWMAPEIFKACKTSEMSGFYSPMADVYSFAITCYEILTGEMPYDKFESHRQISDYVLSGGRPKLPAEIPGDLRNLIWDCWSADPNHRPSFNVICGIIQHLLVLPAEPAKRVWDPCKLL